MKRVLFFISVLAFSFSCEKVIDLPLNEADRKIIIEATLYDIPYESCVKLSKTGSVYDDSGFEKISGAAITIVDDLGNSFLFNESPDQAGLYNDTSFVTTPNRTYSLTVLIEGVEYTAVSKTSSPVMLDSLDYELQTGLFYQQPGDTNFFTYHSFTDNGNETNFYRSIPFKNGESLSAQLNDDKLFNGSAFRRPFPPPIDFGPKDTCTVYLLSMDAEVYLYFLSLESNQGGSAFSPTPANPVSNIEGGALGYFGAYMTDDLTIIFP